MGNNRRNAMQYAAKDMRINGELCTLLIAAEAAPGTATPLDVVAANAPVDHTTATKVPVYGKITWKHLGDFTYGEGGRTVLRKATIELDAQWIAQGQACYAVRLESGAILSKKAENINDTRSLYTLDVEGYVNISE